MPEGTDGGVEKQLIFPPFATPQLARDLRMGVGGMSSEAGKRRTEERPQYDSSVRKENVG